MATTSVLGTIAKESVGWSIALSVLIILAGVLAIVIPPAAGIGVLAVVAWLLMLGGVAHLMFAWHMRGSRAIVWQLLLGVLYLFVGADALLHPVAGLASLTLLLAIYLWIEGIVEIILFFRLRPLGGSPWMLLDGIVTLILACLIWRSWPWSSEWAIGTLIGISMIFSGTARLSLSLAARRVTAALP